ncbi:hypothetical protein Q5O89_12485 [Peribacillus frigoritolerans]|nr:hypothetical protein [Peribacillus frigoritolerans]
MNKVWGPMNSAMDEMTTQKAKPKRVLDKAVKTIKKNVNRVLLSSNSVTITSIPSLSLKCKVFYKLDLTLRGQKANLKGVKR